MKGRYKKRKTYFKVGHKRHEDDLYKFKNQLKPYVRLSIDNFRKIIPNATDSIPKDADDKPCVNAIHLLRPGVAASVEDMGEFPASVDERSDMQCMKLFHPLKLELLINEVILGHANMPKNCDGTLHFDDASKRQVGICFKERLRCNKCEYRSPLHKLYNEVLTSKTGPKPAAPNLGIQAGLTHTGVGNGALRSILMAAGVCPPAMSALQQHANKVGSQLIEQNIIDMKKRCEEINLLNEMKGLGSNAPIRIEGDCRFNNPLFTGS